MACRHSWIVWDVKGMVKEFEEGTDEQAVWTTIKVDQEDRYAECDECGKLLNP